MEQRRQDQYDSLIEEWREAANIEVNEKVWNKIDFEDTGVTIKTSEEDGTTDDTASTEGSTTDEGSAEDGTSSDSGSTDDGSTTDDSTAE